MTFDAFALAREQLWLGYVDWQRNVMYVVGGKITGPIGGWPKRNSQPLRMALPAEVRFETQTGLHARRSALWFGAKTGPCILAKRMPEFGSSWIFAQPLPNDWSWPESGWTAFTRQRAEAEMAMVVPEGSHGAYRDAPR
jgi:hypothetical protein